MKAARDFFKDKKITLVGLGLLGRGVGDAAFLAECGAELLITDLKTKEQLAPSLEKLKDFSNITYILGEHRLEDFRDRDLVVRSGNIPLDSEYIAEAHEHGIPVETAEALFVQLAKDVVTIGVTGTRGKSTVTHLIYEIVRASGHRAFIGGNVQGAATLPLLNQVNEGDVVVLELDSWRLQGFGEAKISPQIAVFTNFMVDHQNYYKDDLDAYFADKANIYAFQTPDDFLVTSSEVLDLIGSKEFPVEAKVVMVDESEVPDEWKTHLLGVHNRKNIAYAVTVARILGIEEEVIKTAVAAFEPVSGRLQFLRELGGVKIYNDNNATTPEATIAALRALGVDHKKKIVLITGGDDKKLDMSGLVAEIPLWCRAVVLFKERGTDTIRDQVFALENVEAYEEEGLAATVARAVSIAKAGEVILYSPGFSSFGKYFKNEYDRGDQFVALIKKLA